MKKIFYGLAICAAVFFANKGFTYTVDANTVALYHFDSSSGGVTP